MHERGFDEISDDEWDIHGVDFKPSRIFVPPPRSIESFAYRPRPTPPPPPPPPTAVAAHVIHIVEDSDDDFEEAPPAAAPIQTRTRGRRVIMDEDSDTEVAEVEAKPVVVENEDEDEIEWSEEDEELEVEPGDEEDIVGKALRKCERISAELKQELYGSAAVDCERYAEVECSAARIVTQEDIAEACTSEELDFEPLLKPYQLVGVNFLLLLYRKNIGGAILADEMGLGKTVQAVTYLTLLKHLDNDPGPHLIVCPASVLENWERELKRWCPSFSVVLFHGAARALYSKELNSLAKAGLPPPFNVLLVCYSLFERRSAQQKDERKILRCWKWSCVITDEAHVLKDKNSLRWKNLMSVAQNARQRLMLTGTPLQNDLHELWSLLEFMMPDIFSAEGVDLKKQLNAENNDLITRIKSILGPFILRRLKSDVMQQLVQKIQRVEYVSMEKVQADTYRGAINEYRAASQARTKLCGAPSNNYATLPKKQISNYFTLFRKVANHPLLVRRIYGEEDVTRFAKILYPMGIFGFECNLERVIQEIKSYNDFEIHRLISSCNVKGALKDHHVLASAKCQALIKLLPSLRKHGHRVLIFSQWTSMLDILEWALDVIGITYKRLDGSTQVTERQTIVDTFNNDSSIDACLLSTRAGGLGLNMIGADTVIIHDMDFNPQVDRQAEDRCHRIGQEKPVTIYRLVTKGTVDENIYEIAKRKLVLDAAVLDSCTDPDNGNDVPEKTMGEILSSLLLV